MGKYICQHSPHHPRGNDGVEEIKAKKIVGHKGGEVPEESWSNSIESDTAIEKLIIESEQNTVASQVGNKAHGSESVEISLCCYQTSP